jgi:hypothetical protein
MIVFEVAISAPDGQTGLDATARPSGDVTELERKYANALAEVMEGFQRFLKARHDEKQQDQ